MKKRPLNITATIDQPDLLGSMIEKLACRHTDIGFSREKMPDNRQALEISSTEAYVSGTLNLSGKKESIDLPFITCFLFTCTKGKEPDYKLAWATSLS